MLTWADLEPEIGQIASHPMVDHSDPRPGSGDLLLIPLPRPWPTATCILTSPSRALPPAPAWVPN